MSKLGLSGELVEITEKNVPLEAAFVTYKTLKETTKNIESSLTRKGKE